GPGTVPGGVRNTEAPAPGGRGGRGSEEGTSRDRDRESMAPASASIVVSLPANAQLKIDDYATRSQSATRTFVTPPLTPGHEYHYTRPAEVRRGNEPVTVTKRVPVRAGEETRITLEFPPATVAQK